MTRRHTSRRRGSIVRLVALLLPAAAGWAAPPAKAAPETHIVTIEAMAFTPPTLHVKVGDRITWINKDPFAHTATSKEGGFDSGSVDAERSWTYTVPRAGTFPYVCTLHPTMKGTVVVE